MISLVISRLEEVESHNSMRDEVVAKVRVVGVICTHREVGVRE